MVWDQTGWTLYAIPRGEGFVIPGFRIPLERGWDDAHVDAEGWAEWAISEWYGQRARPLPWASKPAVERKPKADPPAPHARRRREEPKPRQDSWFEDVVQFADDLFDSLARFLGDVFDDD